MLVHPNDEARVQEAQSEPARHERTGHTAHDQSRIPNPPDVFGKQRYKYACCMYLEVGACSVVAVISVCALPRACARLLARAVGRVTAAAGLGICTGPGPGCLCHFQPLYSRWLLLWLVAVGTNANTKVDTMRRRT